MPEEVIERDAQTPGAPGSGQGNEDKITISKADYERLNRELTETKQSERTWADMARRNAAPVQQAVEEPEEDDIDSEQFRDEEAADIPDDDTPEKLVEDIASKGVSAIKGRGFITAKQAQDIAIETAKKVSRELIGRERQKITADTEVFREFPELRDPNSELFKATSIRYQKAVALDPGVKKTPAALYLAAEAARESLKSKSGAGNRNTRQQEDEEDRRQRANSQDGRPRGGRAVADEDDDDMLGDEAKQVIKLMGVNEADFKKYRDEGRGRR